MISLKNSLNSVLLFYPKKRRSFIFVINRKNCSVCILFSLQKPITEHDRENAIVKTEDRASDGLHTGNEVSFLNAAGQVD